MLITVPIKTVSVLNVREHYHQRAKRAREHRSATWYALKAAKAPHELPLHITVTRIAPRALDGHDNLGASLKACVDGIADWLIVSDNDPRVTFVIAQRAGGVREYGVEIEIV